MTFMTAEYEITTYHNQKFKVKKTEKDRLLYFGNLPWRARLFDKEGEMYHGGLTKMDAIKNAWKYRDITMPHHFILDAENYWKFQDEILDQPSSGQISYKDEHKRLMDIFNKYNMP